MWACFCEAIPLPKVSICMWDVKFNKGLFWTHRYMHFLFYDANVVEQDLLFFKISLIKFKIIEVKSI